MAETVKRAVNLSRAMWEMNVLKSRLMLNVGCLGGGTRRGGTGTMGVPGYPLKAKHHPNGSRKKPQISIADGGILGLPSGKHTKNYGTSPF